MAKSKGPDSSSGGKDARELKKIVDSLYKIVQTTNSSSKEQIRINRELFKTMSMIQSGFVSSAKDAKELISKIESEGFAITDEFITKWAKERKLSKDDLNQILKSFKQIEKVNSEIIDKADNYNDALKKTTDFLDDEVDLTKKILSHYDEILEAVTASKKQIGGFGVGLDSVAKNLKSIGAEFTIGTMFADSNNVVLEFEDLLSKVQSDIKGIVSSTSGELFNVDLNFNPLTNQLDTEIAKVVDSIELEKSMRLDNLRTTFAENERLQKNLMRQLAAQQISKDIEIDIDTGQIKTATGIFEEGSVEFEKLAKKLDKVAIKSGLQDDVIKSLNEIVDLISLGDKMTKQQFTSFQSSIKPLGVAGEILAKNNFEYRTMLDAQQKELKLQSALIQGLTKYTNKLQSAESVVNEIANGFEFVNSLMPAGISEFIGLSKVSSELTRSHTKGVEDFAAKLAEGGNESEAIASYMQAFKPALSLALNPLLLIVTSAVLLFKFVSGITEKLKEMSSELGTSLGQSKQLLQVQLDTLSSQKNQFATIQDIQDVQKAMIGSSGKVFDVMNKDSKELGLNLIEVGKYFGYGTEKAVELQKTFERLGADKKLSLSLQRNVGHMAEMAGLSPQIVAQDLIDSAEEVSTYFAGMPDKAASAAIEVRRMGMSLQQAGKIAKEMLNLEGFMTDMYELQAMTGGGIDFSEAFDKGLMGDIEGMTKSIMDQIGTTAEYNNMDFLTRTKIANTLGMSNDELAKSVMLREKMAGLDDDTKAALEANKDRLGDISLMSQEDLQNKLTSLQSTDKLGIAWDKIKGVLVNALLPVVESFSGIIDAISPVLDLIIMQFKGVGLVIKMILPIIEGIILPFKFLGILISKITSHIDGMNSGLASGSKWIENIRQGVVYLAAGFTTIATVLKIFGVDLFKPILGFIGGLLQKIPLIGSLFGSVGKNSKDSVATASASVTDMTTKVTSSLQSMVANVQSSLSSVADTIKKTFSDLTSNAESVSTKAAGISSKVAESTVNDVTKVQKATKQMTAEAQTGIAKTQSIASKGGNLSFINSGTAKKTFGTIGEIASKTFAVFAMRSATSFLTMKKDGEEQTSELANNMTGIFDVAMMGIAPLMMGYLQEGIEKVFSKKIEKKIEGALENPIKKLSKRFETLEKPATDSFTKIESKGKGIFRNIADFAKKILPGSTTSVTGTFDNLADQSKKIETATTVTKPIQDVSSKTTSGFSSFSNILKSVWDGIKTVLDDIVKFVSNTVKELSSGIGTAIKNVLTGIGDGLSSFKTSAIKGAAAMVILSGALWITSKAVQNFASVKWEDLAKAGAAMAGLVATAMIVSSASGQMITGAAAIAILGASLIPAAYALNEFNNVEWSSLAKAGLTLGALGLAAALIGMPAVLPFILAGAGGIAALGASLLPLAAALLIATPGLEAFGNVIEKAFNGISTVITATASGISQIFQTLTSVDISKLLSIGPALASIGLGFAAMSAGALSGGISKLFGGDIVKDLEKLGNLADPLYVVKNVLEGMADVLFTLSEALSSLDVDGIEKLGKVAEIGIEAKVNQKIKPMVDNFQTIQQDSTRVKMSPVQTQVAQVQTPRKESVAQDKKITSLGGVSQRDQNGKIISTVENNYSTERFNSQKDTYNEDVVPDNLETNMLMKQMIQLLTVIAKKEPELILDGYKVNASLKKYNNSK